MSGRKIIDSLKGAVAGNFSRVTIDGQTWQKVDPLCPAGFSHLDSWNAAIESAARVLQSANDETSRKCIVEAIRRLSKS